MNRRSWTCLLSNGLTAEKTFPNNRILLAWLIDNKNI